MQDILNQLSSFVNIDVIWYILLFPFIFFWVWTILYTTKDISHRTDSLIYQIFCILLSAIPLVWFLLYFIFRPVRLLDDISWRKSLDTLSITCNDCGEINCKDNVYCVSCGESLTVDCKECWKKYYSWYDYCPSCGAPNLELE